MLGARHLLEIDPGERELGPASGQRSEEGAAVRIAATGAEGTVVEIRDGRATVETGGIPWGAVLGAGSLLAAIAAVGVVVVLRRRERRSAR